jgi:RNA-directed DNA polymerase
MPVVKFNELQSFGHLSLVWGVAVEDLTTINNSADQSGWYSEMQIPKRGKANRDKFRTVYKVEWGILKQLQKNISRDIDDTNLFPDCVKGFVRGRSAIGNAKAHVDQRVILHADIKDFFDSITTEQVLGAFIRLGCKKDIATVLTKICTLNGRLPQGASTSPVVSNLVCSGLDSDLTAFASRQGARYTRYADDLTLSTSGTSNAKEFCGIVDAVRGIVELHGFKLREDKTRTQRRGKSQYVTGLCVAAPSEPRAPPRVKRRLRLELYYAKKFGIQNHLSRVEREWTELRLRAYFRGWIDYLHSVPAESALAQRLRKQLESL